MNKMNNISDRNKHIIEIPLEIMSALSSEYGFQLLGNSEEIELMIGIINNKKYKYLFEEVWTDIQCRFFQQYFKRKMLEDDYEMFCFSKFLVLLREEPYNNLKGYTLFMNRLALAERLVKEYGIDMSMYLLSHEDAWKIDMLGGLLLLRRKQTEELVKKQKDVYRELKWSSGEMHIRPAKNLRELVKSLELHIFNLSYDKKHDFEEICLGRKQLLLIIRNKKLYATLLMTKYDGEEIYVTKRGRKYKKLQKCIQKYLKEVKNYGIPDR